MTHDRPHRNAISPIEALQELRRCAPAGYDPAVVEALAESLSLSAPELVSEPRPVGSGLSAVVR
jgi:HD-GYP domain-containing protein (c-di-GMP phosphodiesterase class II)